MSAPAVEAAVTSQATQAPASNPAVPAAPQTFVQKLQDLFLACLNRPPVQTTTAAPIAQGDAASALEAAKTQVDSTLDAAKSAVTTAVTTFQTELQKHNAAEPTAATTTPLHPAKPDETSNVT